MDERPLDLAVLRTFSPLDGLKAENLHALARKTQIRDLAAGRVLFKEGDTDKRTFYLVAGSIEMRAEDKLIGTVRAGTPEARAALAPGLPRKFTARAAVEPRALRATPPSTRRLTTQMFENVVAEIREFVDDGR